MQEFRCPWCQVAMIKAVVGRFEIDICETCGARWFDRTELAATLATLGSRVPPSWGRAETDRQPGPACPRDGTPLVTFRWLGGDLARCSACHGVLVDGISWRLMSEQATRRPHSITPSDVAGSLLEIVLETLSLGDGA